MEILSVHTNWSNWLLIINTAQTGSEASLLVGSWKPPLPFTWSTSTRHTESLLNWTMVDSPFNFCWKSAYENLSECNETDFLKGTLRMKLIKRLFKVAIYFLVYCLAVQHWWQHFVTLKFYLILNYVSISLETPPLQLLSCVLKQMSVHSGLYTCIVEREGWYVVCINNKQSFQWVSFLQNIVEILPMSKRFICYKWN